MNAAVWKFPLQLAERQVIEMPVGAKLLTVQIQHDIPCIWALVDPAAPTTPLDIRTLGTGQAFDAEDFKYIGTYQIHGGGFVFHVFHF